MLDEVPREPAKTASTFVARRDVSPEGKPRVVGIVAIANSGPSSNTLYRTAAGSHPAVDPIRQLRQFNRKINKKIGFAAPLRFDQRSGG
jgi:hypothetical protein